VALFLILIVDHHWGSFALPRRLSCLIFQRMRLIPIHIQIIGNEIALKWNDEKESYLHFEKLRRACPCAGCGGEPDVMGHVIRPQVTYTPASFVLKSYQIIGGYALQPVWQDGHSSGLYSFDFLRRLTLGDVPA